MAKAKLNKDYYQRYPKARNSFFEGDDGYFAASRRRTYVCVYVAR